MTSEQSKGLVATAFESWAEGDGDFFSISPTMFHGPLRVHRRSRARTRAAGISSRGPFNRSARVCRNRFGPWWRRSLRRETRSSCSGMVMRWRRTAWVRQPLLLGHANGARDCQRGRRLL